MKTCLKCNAVKPTEQFGADRQKPGGKKLWCRDCMLEYDRGRRAKIASRAKPILTSKTCSLCKAELPSKNFGFDKTIKDGHTRYCRACVAIQNRETRLRITAAVKVIPKTKVCARCHREKESTAFSRCRTIRCGLHPYCKTCRAIERTSLECKAHVAAKMRAFRKANSTPFTPRWWGLRILPHTKFRMPDVRLIEQMFNQNPCCAYCGVNLRNASEKFHLDHKLPRCRGGQDTVENVAICCDVCNRMKSRMTDTEFRAFLLEYISRFDHHPVTSQIKMASLSEYASKEPSL